MREIKACPICGVSAPQWDWVKVESLWAAENSSFVAGLQQTIGFQPAFCKSFGKIRRESLSVPGGGFMLWLVFVGPDLKIGQNLNCIIVEVKNEGRVVRLSVDRSEVAASLATERQNWTLSNLLPGLVVKARVQKVNSSLGLFWGFWGFFFWALLKAGRQVK